MGHTFFAGSLMPPRSHRAAAALPFSLGVHAAVVGGLLALPLLAGDAPPVVTARPLALPTISIALPRVEVAPPAPASPRSAARVAPRAPSRPVMEAPATIPVPLTPDVPAFDPTAGAPRVCEGCALTTSGDGRTGSGFPIGSDPGPGTGTGAGAGSEPIRIGGAVSAPAKLRHVDPVYPELAKRAGVQGIVIIECVIDRDGRVARTRVLRSIPLLDAAAVAAVEQWRYRPTLLNGVPVQVRMTVTVHFNLR
jgi:protein TonB